MMKKLFSFTILLSMFLNAAYATDFEGSLYIEDATIVPGEQTVLSVQMNNNIPIRGFQFKVTLPSGISYVSWDISSDRLPSGATINDKVGDQSFKDQVLSIASSLNFGEESAFTGNDGEVATIIISADENIAEGVYSIQVSEIDVSDLATIDYDVESTSFNLTVTKQGKTYADGYSVQILPFSFNDDTEVPLTLNNASALTNIAFDIILPSTFTTNELYYIDAALAKNKFSLNETQTTSGAIHVSLDRRSSNVIAANEGTDIVFLGLVNSPDIEEGIYPISIKNIKLTDTQGNVLEAAPYTTEIFAGAAPKISATDSYAAFHGNYGGQEEYQLLTASLVEGVIIDLTETTALYASPSTLFQDILFLTKEDYVYGRTLNGEWGTLCLPFAVESGNGIQLYKMSSANSDALFFDKVSSVEANTPVLFKSAENTINVKMNNDGSITHSFIKDHANSLVQEQSITGWVFNGSYSTKTLNVSSLQAYALNHDTFYKVTSKLTVKAFRGWYQNNGTALGAALRISEDTEDISIIEQEGGSVRLTFDVQGRLQKDLQSKQINIVNGEKQYNQ